MRIGDASRARRFANPARLRWYAFHRSVRFALRMMGPDQEIPPGTTFAQMPCLEIFLEGSRDLEISEKVPNRVEPAPN